MGELLRGTLLLIATVLSVWVVFHWLLFSSTVTPVYDFIVVGGGSTGSVVAGRLGQAHEAVAAHLSEFTPLLATSVLRCPSRPGRSHQRHIYIDRSIVLIKTQGDICCYETLPPATPRQEHLSPRKCSSTQRHEYPIHDFQPLNGICVLSPTPLS
eukprot:6183030-Pleurochrysis_carterae.AAC.1